MHSNYEKAYAIEKRYEGGNIDHPRDPGGRTSRGVTQRVYSAYRKRKGQPTQDVFRADETEIAEIYRQQYADVVRFDDLPSGIDLVVFDGAINSGPKQSIKWIQAGLNAMRQPSSSSPELVVDGVMGLITLQAIETISDHDALIGKILDLRMSFLKRLRTWRDFGKGWTARVKNLRSIGQAWASGSVGPEPVHIVGGEAKALPSDIKVSSTTAGKGAITTALGAIGAAAGQAKDALAPLAGEHWTIGWTFTGLTVLGVVALVAGIAISTYAQTRQIAQAAPT